ncbi:hypothetical protein DOK78_002985 [Enterococcus sp. DIV2402]|uniref:DUF871 domain-containing protein n=1 Tax=Candidatus Enterococcus lowellii TaxID=2230877 RepID=A0ABZ2SRD6_9ENTE|nr:DUF871 domain-containing protein [Enterococcus sp. DIV2402]
MLGFSVFLGDEFQESKRLYIEKMFHSGFKRVFTSLHIPEDDESRMVANLKELCKLTKAFNCSLMVDISSDGLRRLQIDLNDEQMIAQLLSLGVTGIRMDYGIDFQTIARVSQQLVVGLNASTLTEADVEELVNYQANFENMELWHNYYPRPETGLSEPYLHTLNQKWRKLGFKIIAFVPGDKNLRGPLHAGLPTLEGHRLKHPLVAAVDLLQNYACDEVCIGDEGLREQTQQQFIAYFKEQKVVLPVQIIDETHRELFIGTHTNRVDDARDVLRSQEARFKQLPLIMPNGSVSRVKGSVTLDNQKYLRYMGELQISKRDLPADEKVNVVAKVIDSEVDLLTCVLPGYRFELVESGNDNE